MSQHTPHAAERRKPRVERLERRLRGQEDDFWSSLELDYHLAEAARLQHERAVRDLTACASASGGA